MNVFEKTEQVVSLLCIILAIILGVCLGISIHKRIQNDENNKEEIQSNGLIRCNIEQKERNYRERRAAVILLLRIGLGVYFLAVIIRILDLLKIL